MKRFFKSARLSENDEGYSVALDGRTLQTTGGTTLALSSRTLVVAIAEEWEAQKEEIAPHAMLLMRLASTALDRVAAARDKVIADALEYATTDLLCYRAGEPASLAQRQAEAWQPLLDWAAERYGAHLIVTTEMVPVDQPAASLAALKAAMVELDDLQLTALQDFMSICNSLILGLALVEGEISAETAWEISELDENFQIEKWGSDPEAEKRRKILREDLMAAECFLSLGR